MVHVHNVSEAHTFCIPKPILANYFYLEMCVCSKSCPARLISNDIKPINGNVGFQQIRVSYEAHFLIDGNYAKLGRGFISNSFQSSSHNLIRTNCVCYFFGFFKVRKNGIKTSLGWHLFRPHTSTFCSVAQ